MNTITKGDQLTRDEQRELIATAQAVPVTTLTDEDGNNHTRYGTTPAADQALETLTRAFLPLIYATVAQAKRVNADDAFAVCLEELVTAVRQHDLTSTLMLGAILPRRFRYRLLAEERTEATITVRKYVVDLYWRVMTANSLDVGAAYNNVLAGGTGLDASTFLAVHAAMLPAATPEDAHAHHDPNQEANRFLNNELVTWLFTTVTPEQQQILRLRYGFDDHTTTELLGAHGLRAGEEISDVLISAVLGTSLAFVQRNRTKALAVMAGEVQHLANEN